MTLEEKAKQYANSTYTHSKEASDAPLKEMKAYPDETLGISDIHKYSHILFDAFEKLECCSFS